MSDTDFGALGVPAPLVDYLSTAGFTSAFPIQTATLPDTLAGRDVLGRGRTGSGKTLAFALPLVTRLARSGGAPAARTGSNGRRPQRTRPGYPRGLVLAPTRELATQIAAVVEPLAAVYGLSVTTIFGGVSQHRQVTTLRAGVDIVIACPGRLEDLIGQGHVHLSDIAITVLDEADHMADLGFLPGVTRIMNRTPAGGQRMLFSATLDNGVDTLVRRYLSDELRHSVDSASSPVTAMTHRVFDVADPATKRAVVQTLASGTGRRILFMRTKHQAKKLARQLTQAGIPSVDLHGNLSQNQRDRNLKAFSDGTSKVLVATDVAARGVHVDDVELVVHVDPPAEHKAYLHRSGRTARAGSQGDVLTLVLPEQRRDTQQMMRRAKVSVRPEPVTADSPAVATLVGEVAPYVTPQPPAHTAGSSGGGRSRQRPAGRGRRNAPRSNDQRDNPQRGNGQGGNRQRPAGGGGGRRRPSRGRGRSTSGGGPRGGAGAVRTSGSR